MNLRPRGVATDAATAALDVMAAARYLAAADVADRRILVREAALDGAIGGWPDGVAVVRVSGSAAREAALATAEAAGIPASMHASGGAMSGGDRDAARFELGLEPDDTVQLVLGAAGLRNLGERLAAFDAGLAADPTPRRLVLAGLPDHSPALSADLIAAIVHPQVLVESEPSDDALLAILRLAADLVED